MGCLIVLFTFGQKDLASFINPSFIRQEKVIKEYFEGTSNINDAKYGIWMDQSVHRSGAYAYNQRWLAVFRDGKKYSSSELWAFAQEFMEKVYHITI